MNVKFSKLFVLQLFFASVVLSACITHIETKELQTGVRLVKNSQESAGRPEASRIEMFDPSTSRWYEAKLRPVGTYEFTPKGLAEKLAQQEMDLNNGSGDGDEGGGSSGDGGSGY